MQLEKQDGKHDGGKRRAKEVYGDEQYGIQSGDSHLKTCDPISHRHISARKHNNGRLQRIELAPICALGARFACVCRGVGMLDVDVGNLSA